MGFANKGQQRTLRNSGLEPARTQNGSWTNTWTVRMSHVASRWKAFACGVYVFHVGASAFLIVRWRKISRRANSLYIHTTLERCQGPTVWCQTANTPSICRAPALHTISDPNHGIYKVLQALNATGKHLALITPADEIHRSVHLYPKFGAVALHDWTSTNVMERCTQFYTNPRTDRHAYIIFS